MREDQDALEFTLIKHRTGTVKRGQKCTRCKRMMPPGTEFGILTGTWRNGRFFSSVECLRLGDEYECPLDRATPEDLSEIPGFFFLGRDARLRECSTEGCHQCVSWRVEFGSVGSDHCEPCARKIAKCVTPKAERPETEGRDNA